MMLSAGRARQQSTKSCSRNCGNNGSSRGYIGSGDGFDVGSGNNSCSDNSNSHSNVDGESNDDNHAESIMLTAGGAKSIILSAPSLKS
jgi:hypothetical protein